MPVLKHLQKFCVLNLASAGCDCSWIVTMSWRLLPFGVNWVVITCICLGKKLWVPSFLKGLAHNNTILLLLISQQMWHKSCNNLSHVQILCRILWQDLIPLHFWGSRPIEYSVVVCVQMMQRNRLSLQPRTSLCKVLLSHFEAMQMKHLCILMYHPITPSVTYIQNLLS
jgi:hypothetical protein